MQAWIFVTTSYVGWVPCHTDCHRSTQLAPCLPVRAEPLTTAPGPGIRPGFTPNSP